MTELTLGKALGAGLRQAMRDDDKVVLLGEDIGKLGGVFRITDGLLDEGFRMSTAATRDGWVMRGEEYLRGVLENLPGAFSPAEICAAVKKEMKGERRKKDRLTDDDITIIALRRK